MFTTGVTESTEANFSGPASLKASGDVFVSKGLRAPTRRHGTYTKQQICGESLLKDFHRRFIDLPPSLSIEINV